MKMFAFCLAISAACAPARAAVPAGSCVATASQAVVATNSGTMSCSYVAGGSLGRIVEVTPNKIVVTERGSDGLEHQRFHQYRASLPGVYNFPTHAGWTVTVVVGPDIPPDTTQALSGGFVQIGDAA